MSNVKDLPAEVQSYLDEYRKYQALALQMQSIMERAETATELQNALKYLKRKAEKENQNFRFSCHQHEINPYEILGK